MNRTHLTNSLVESFHQQMVKDGWDDARTATAEYKSELDMKTDKELVTEYNQQLVENECV